MEPKLTKPLPEPAILTAKLHNQAPGETSAKRVANETRALVAVADYFASLGLSVLPHGNIVTGAQPRVQGGYWMLVTFCYCETYQAVFKFFEIKRRVKGQWRPASMTLLRKYAAQRQAAYDTLSAEFRKEIL